MPRRRRVIQPGFPYHVMLRGNGGQKIFHDDEDRSRLCLLIQYAVEKHRLRVHAFCLMGNHIHLLVEPSDTDLSAAVQSFASRYAQYFNRKYERRGHVFQGRYKAIVVQGGVYLRRLARYIHRNPLRAGLVNRPEQYAWSSHRSYLRLDAFTWLHKTCVLDLFEKRGKETELDTDDALAQFEQYTLANDADAKEQLEVIRNASRTGAFGDRDFVKKYAGQGPDKLELINRISEGGPLIQLQDLIDVACDYFRVSEADVCGATRRGSVVRARATIVLVAARSNLSSLSGVAERLSRDHSSMSRLRTKAQTDPELTKGADEIYNKLLALAKA